MKLNDLKVEIILPANSNFPSLLKEIPDSPLKIYALGNLFQGPLREETKIAIVGTRKATYQGKMIAKKVARKLAELGIIIVSGLAMGIDTAAHEGAIEAGGKTIAVLACGLDTIYPRQNENLARKIIDFGGAVISEYPVGTPPFPSQFLERNRIISGLSIASIIVEAPCKSGALVTARLAAEQGREVFVFPGPTDNPNYFGSHKLIRDGARLAASIGDVLDDLGFSEKGRKEKIEAEFEKIIDENQLLIIKAIKETGQPINIDKIIELTKLEPQIVNKSLTLLIIQEILKETEKGYAI